LQNVSQFEILSGKIPKNWHIGPGKIELFTICPLAWHALGFWEDCYDLKPDALEIYKREARIIYEEEDALSSNQ
jgi:hypothetical protein